MDSMEESVPPQIRRLTTSTLIVPSFGDVNARSC